jgi:hypothetical protein
VRSGDQLTVNTKQIKISKITDTVQASILPQAELHTIPTIQADDINALRADMNRQSQLTQQPADALFPPADVPPATDRIVPAHRSADDYAGAIRNLPGNDNQHGTPTFRFETEYRYPVDYQVLILPQADGSWQPLVLPRRFETYSGTGLGAGYYMDNRRSRRGNRSSPSTFSPPEYLRIPHPDAQDHLFSR